MSIFIHLYLFNISKTITVFYIDFIIASLNNNNNNNNNNKIRSRLTWMEIIQIFLIAFFSIFFFILCCGCCDFFKEQERSRRMSYESAQSILSLYPRRQRRQRRHNPRLPANTLVNMDTASQVSRSPLPTGSPPFHTDGDDTYTPIFLIAPQQYDKNYLQKYATDLPTYEQAVYEKPK